MHRSFINATLAFAATGLAACTAQDPPEQPAAEQPAAASEAAALPPFKAAVPLAVLMRSTVTMAAERYWESVSIVVDIEGEHENYPQTDEEWFEVWEAGITLAESGNLMMLPSRALDQGEWMRLAGKMVDAGMNAARAADARDHLRMLDEGENVYNVCTECHEKYVPSIRL